MQQDKTSNLTFFQWNEFGPSAGLTAGLGSVRVSSNLSKAIPKSQKDPRNFIQHTVHECFCLMPVNNEEVVKIISSFKDSSAGWDELKPGIIKNIKDCITMPLTHICNLSFKQGMFPTQLKIANVVPIYKTGNEHVFSNYRPVQCYRFSRNYLKN